MEKIQFDHTKHKDMPHFTHDGTLPSLNEYLAAEARHPKAGGKLKREYKNMLSWEIRKGLKRWKATRPVYIHFVYFEPNRKRDKDNIHAFACKCTMDALQSCGVIKNDGWADVINFTHDFYVDTKNPRIEVYIEEECK